jgi:hypothetical protein
MRSCVLHIGTHKTGTTSIQMALAGHPEVLEKAGYIYPLAGRPYGLAAHHDLALCLRDSRRSNEKERLVAALLAEVRETPYDVILSSEEFIHALYHSPEAFVGFVTAITATCPLVTLVIYVRRQADFLMSNYIERLKYGLDMPFAAYALRRLECDLDEFPLDYSVILGAAERLANVRVAVRLYEAARTRKRGVVEDFLGLLGIPSGALQDIARHNQRGSLHQGFLAYHQNRTGRAPTFAERQVIARILPDVPMTALRPAYSTRLAITQRLAPSNQDIAARYGLACLAEAEPPIHGPVFDYFFSAELSSAVAAFATVQEQLNRTDAALSATQRLAVERYAELKALEDRLNATHVALAEAQHLALQRYAAMMGLETKLNATQAALAEAQRLALQRHAAVMDAEARLSATQTALADAQRSTGARIVTRARKLLGVTAARRQQKAT